MFNNRSFNALKFGVQIGIIVFTGLVAIKFGAWTYETLKAGITSSVISTVTASQGAVEAQPVPTVELSELSEMSEQLKRLQYEVESLSQWLLKVEWYVKKDHGFYLYVLDTDLDILENGGEPRGSFSDYFVPTLDEALDVGVPTEELRIRVERVIELAERGHYYSDYLRKLMNDGGPDNVREYVWGKE